MRASSDCLLRNRQGGQPMHMAMQKGGSTPSKVIAQHRTFIMTNNDTIQITLKHEGKPQEGSKGLECNET